MANFMVNLLSDSRHEIHEVLNVSVSGKAVLEALHVEMPPQVWEHPIIVSSYVEVEEEEKWNALREALNDRGSIRADELSPDQIMTRVVPLSRSSNVAFVPDDLGKREDLQLFTSFGDVRGRLRFTWREDGWASPTFDTPLGCDGRCDPNSGDDCRTCCEDCQCRLFDDKSALNLFGCYCPNRH